MDKKIFELTKKIDLDLKENNLSDEEKKCISEKLKKLLPTDSIVLAQISPVAGDVKNNAQKALNWIKWAQSINVGAIVFPELFLVGYPIGDAIKKFPIIVEENREWLKALATKVTTKTKVIIGFVEKNESNVGKEYFNSIAVLSNGKIEKTIKASVIPNYSEYNDYKYFEPAQIDTQNRIINIEKNNVAITISEEAWNDKDFFERTLYKEDPIKKVIDEQKPDYIINCTTSITRTNKEQLKNNLFSHLSKKYKTPFVYVNQVGAADSFVFDGASRVYDKDGSLIARAKTFEEHFFIVSPTQTGEINLLPKGQDEQKDKAFSLCYEDDLERIYNALIYSIKEYFRKTGFKRAVLGLSGGLDSTISAVLLADALGKENVFGISMPSKITSKESKNDAEILAKNLGINFLEMPIKEMFDNTREQFDIVFNEVQKNWNCRYKESFTNDNIQARSRAIILWGVANEFEACLPIATSDKSEFYMGYATINGDMSGGFAPLADVTKTKLFALAEWMNKSRKIKNAIPQSIIDKRPGAELAINPKTGKPLLAEEALMPYEFLDEIIWRVENLNQSIDEMLKVEFIYEQKMANSEPISKEQKLEWLQKFFRRMSTSLYKGSIMPPAPIIDSQSINAVEYKQPITASKINHYKTSFETKLKELK